MRNTNTLSRLRHRQSTHSRTVRGLMDSRRSWVLVASMVGLVAMSGCGASDNADPEASSDASVRPSPPATAEPVAVVPDVVGIAVQDAEEVLSDSGWKVRIVELDLADLDPDDPDDPGAVVAQSEIAGTETPAPGSIELQVVPDYVVVPSVTDLSKDAAILMLAELGLDVTVRESPSADKQAGTVLRSRPEAGELVAPRASIRLDVAVAPTHRVTLNLLVDDYDWSQLGDEGCEYPFWNLRQGASVQLIGPDGAVLSAAYLTAGRIQDDECIWHVFFSEIPEVSAYSITVSSSDVSWPTVSLKELRDSSWNIYFGTYDE